MEEIFEIDSLEIFSRVSEEILGNLFDSKPLATAVTLDPEIVVAAKEDIRKLLSHNCFDIQRVAVILQAQEWDEKKVEIFISLMEKKKTEILYATLSNLNSEHGETIVDYDWGVKYVCGANQSKTLRYPLLQLMLNTDTSMGDRKQRVYDIKKEIVSQLIDALDCYK